MVYVTSIWSISFCSFLTLPLLYNLFTLINAFSSSPTWRVWYFCPHRLILQDGGCSCPNYSRGSQQCSRLSWTRPPLIFWSLWGQPVVFSRDTFIVGLLSDKALVSHCAELVLFQCCAQQHSCRQKTQGYSTLV